VPEDDKDKFSGITYLYIPTNPLDDGTEPLAAGLPFWVSPAIVIVRPNGTRGDTAEEGAVNQVEVTVHNRGGITAVDAYVDAFVADPSTAFTPATAMSIGGDYVTVPGYSTGAILLPWTPTAADSSGGGHRCLLARVRLVVPLDTYRDPTIFDVVGDRHVAQRNIHVVTTVSGRRVGGFGFQITNPRKRKGSFRVAVRELKATARNRRVLRATVGDVGPLAERPLAGLRLQITEAVEEGVPAEHLGTERDVPRDVGHDPTVFGELDALPDVTRGASQTLDLGADEVRNAVVVYSLEAEGGAHVLEVAQTDVRTRRAVGGLWIVVRT
jgi:hypothetical protein